uniref:Glycosyltransferase family 10 (Fucosyltransferase) C-term n=1 Tax=Candidatus Kentrum sp. DK TaxID=2126562 RepID=A0A450SQ36_9GAMM|nr:MAG: Glycosyltransferase family 10 (fucosyltransferase) C-term [Candidatus Kentron sp. DK]
MSFRHKKITVGSEGMGIWGRILIDHLLRILDPNVTIEWKNDNSCSFIVKSHFLHLEKKWTDKMLPFVYWSGESHPVQENDNHTRYIHINANLSDGGIYVPFLAFNIKIKNGDVYRMDNNKRRNYFLAYCNSNCVPEREYMFDLLVERDRTGTCHSLGDCCGSKGVKKRKIAGDWGPKLIKAYSNYKFVMAMENRVVPGYITEKIINAFHGGAIPVYWGDNIVKVFFNTDAFVHVNDFDSFEACADYLCNMNQDEIAWMMHQPIFRDNKIDDRLRMGWGDDVPEYYRNMAAELGKILE